jgi:hypothetical protein
MTTVLDALLNGWINLHNGLPELGLEQIGNAITALSNGMMPEDCIQKDLDSELSLTPSHTDSQNE